MYEFCPTKEQLRKSKPAILDKSFIASGIGEMAPLRILDAIRRMLPQSDLKCGAIFHNPFNWANVYTLSSSESSDFYYFVKPLDGNSTNYEIKRISGCKNQTIEILQEGNTTYFVRINPKSGSQIGGIESISWKN